MFKRHPRMAQDVNHDLETHADWAAVHLDIQSALTNVRRTALIQALEQIDPGLLMSQSHWIRRPSPFIVQRQDNTQQLHHAEVGVPQGDPFSSWAFAVSLSLAMKAFRDAMTAQGLQDGQHYACRAYVDDVVMTGARDVLPAMVTAWEEALTVIGLSLQRDKMQVYCPNVSPHDLASSFHCAQEACSGDGVVICGLALTHDV